MAACVSVLCCARRWPIRCGIARDTAKRAAEDQGRAHLNDLSSRINVLEDKQLRMTKYKSKKERDKFLRADIKETEGLIREAEKMVRAHSGKREASIRTASPPTD
jgi:hypothetical protein